MAQQIPLAKLDRMPGPERGYSMDKWDGYDASRSRLLSFLGTRRPSNPVTLAGDVHNNWVNDLRMNVDDPNTSVVATEFVGTSITSGGDGSDRSPLMDAMASENECVRFCNNQRGYVQIRAPARRAARRFSRGGIRDAAGISRQHTRVVCRGVRTTRSQARLEQRRDDPRPLLVEVVMSDRLPGTAIPVAGVAEIPFLPMKVCMDPGACRSSRSCAIE